MLHVKMTPPLQRTVTSC